MGVTISDPNDLLGLSYALAVLELGVQDQVTLLPLQRQGNGYHSTQISEKIFASASGIRHVLKNNLPKAKLMQQLPIGTQQMLMDTPFLDYEQSMWRLLRYKVLTTPVEQLEQIYQLNDGLAYRLLEIIEKNAQTKQIDWDAFMQQFKSKRYTYSRLQRSILYLLLNITTDEMQVALQQPYLRPLAFNTKGQLWLKQGRKHFRLPVIGKIDQNNLKGPLKLDLRAGRLYNMLQNNFEEQPQDMKRQPYRENNLT